MKAPRAPRLDPRRKDDFSAELRERAGAWIPSWDLADNEGDFGRALLEIAGRFNSEVAEHLDLAGEKMRRGFLDWLAVRGKAARPARMPVVFKLADNAREAVLAEAPVRLQVDAGGTPVVFETEKDVRILPGRLETVVGVDAENDALYLPSPGLSELAPLEPVPTQWQLKSFAAAGASRMQLDPEAGLVKDLVIEAGGQQYRIANVDKDLITVDRPLVAGLEQASTVTKVTTFAPFDGRTWNRQEHALYLGDSDLFNVEQAATIEVFGATALVSGVTWEYWGKGDGDDDEEKWRRFAKAEVAGSALVLTKRKGAIAQTEVGGKKSRWIRAQAKTRSSDQQPITVEAFSIRINSGGCADVACPASDDLPGATAEATANTTPLVLESPRGFLPLGREPRQFDAFHLGSQEAFSKKGAKVQICFEMADSSFRMLGSLPVGLAGNFMVAGVSADGRLHLFQFDPTNELLTRYPNRDPLRPPSPGSMGAPIDQPPISLDGSPDFRPGMWTTLANDTFVAVTAKAAVWAWREAQNASDSGWQSLGEVAPDLPPDTKIEGLVYLSAPGGDRLYALRDKRLFVRELNNPNAAWDEVTTQDLDNSNNPVAFKRIAPIAIDSGVLGPGKVSEGMVGVGDNEILYGFKVPANSLIASCEQLLANIAKDVTPAAVRRNDNRLVAVAMGNGQPSLKIYGFLSTVGTFNQQGSTQAADVEWPKIIGGEIDVQLEQAAQPLTFAFCSQLNAEAIGLHAWTPFPPLSAPVYRTKIPPQVGIAIGAPALLPKHVIVPVVGGKLIVAPFRPSLRQTETEPLEAAVIASVAADKLLTGDFVAIPKEPTGYEAHPAPTGIDYEGETFYEFVEDSRDDAFFVYRATGTVTPGAIVDTFNIAVNATIQLNTILLVTTNQFGVALLGIVDAPGNAALHHALPVGTTNVSYQLPDPNGARLRPLIRLNPPTTGNWDSSVLDVTRLLFPGADPLFQNGTAIQEIASQPELIVLKDHWVVANGHPTLIVQKAKFIVDLSVGEWKVQLGDPSPNAELSWEYWNGTGWWKLDGVEDFTSSLTKTGRVVFAIPTDLRPTDVAGKTNHWIRARLVFGDYGREKVTVKTKQLGGGDTEQTIVRSTEGIRAPTVSRLRISYAICKEVQPAFVLAQDSGSLRDQSDANRTAGAIVEAFVPVALLMERLSRGSIAAATPADCDCGTKAAAAPGLASASATTSTTSSRALFIGLAATPSGASVNVLLLVERESKHDRFAPMKIDALIADRFVPIVVDDTTRALGESGLLTMAFTVPPTPRALFGQENLTWLRLTPGGSGPANEWSPNLRGAYLNAVWASATETLTRELLGSSDGRPNFTVRLARPPVLDGTLELRVKEPLGEEERKALTDGDANRVASAVDGLAGDWVLWKQVVDPLDEGPAERVYALDESLGEIRFGDGQHGMIPPIGRDSIVAFRYSRTEPDPAGGDRVPGNTIIARTTANLVSPVESVESVTVADQSAGGAPPESDERVLRFGFSRFRHRERVLTAHDLEDLALQSSPDIAQARAVIRRTHTRLIVVMRGTNPQPNAAQVRELRRLLLDAGPLSLSAPDALRITGPDVRKLRVELRLRVETLDRAGALSEFVTTKLESFFDTAAGGIDGDGWPLSIGPSEDDVALALLDAPYLESIAGVTLVDTTDKNRTRPWPQTLEPTELAMLDEDPVRIAFETAEVLV